MAVDGFVNEIELRKAIEQLHPDGELFEVRVISSDKRKKPASGYFKTADDLLAAFKTYDLRNTNVYITLQQINSALFSRQQSNRFVAGANSTQDNEVSGYKWLFVDLDPERPTGISSSDDELKKSFELAKKVKAFMKDYGFEDPVRAISGNGAHLLYRINLANTDENKALIEKCLKVLSMLFDTDEVKVDTTNFNQSRVCKLYGSLAQKGANTSERPHRMSRIIGDLTATKPTDVAYLRKLAAELPEDPPVQPNKYNNYNAAEFDIENWMDQYGLRYNAKPWNGGIKYILEECPFDPNHKAPDSMITKAANGAIGFKCLHRHCQNYHWRELRLKFEPDAYDHDFNETDRRIEEGWARHNKEKAQVIQQQLSDDTPIFQTPEMILNHVQPEPEYIRTGIRKLDKALCGLEKGKLSIISGLRASAKSTFLSEIMLNAVDDNHTVIAYSGELSNTSFMDWMYLQAAGKGNVECSAKYENFYYVELETKKKIARWMSDRLWLFNNVKSNKPSFLLKHIKDQCLKTHGDLIIIDNLMALDVQELNRANEYDAQTRFMWELKKVAQECNAHIILVAHPRKSQGFLRLEDVSGTNNIVNIIDNAFIIHRNNADFKEKSKSILKATGAEWMIDEGSTVTNVVEIAKDREHGTCDVFINLYYEPESKRLKNDPSENIVYGWNDDWISVEQEEIPFDC